MQRPLFDTGYEPVCVASAESAAARSWCDPGRYGEVIGLDFGGLYAHYFMAKSGQHGRLAVPALMSWLLSLSDRTLVVCEWAHLAVPQTRKSLAQPYSAEELVCLYRALEQRGVKLMLAPHQHTGKHMRAWAAKHHASIVGDGSKSDIADAASLALYVRHCNGVSLANPPKSFGVSLRRAFGRSVCDLSNTVLNAERTCAYAGIYFPTLASIARIVEQRCLGPVTMPVAMSVVSTIAYEDEQGLRLFTHRGQVPGRGLWMRHVIRMSPFHHRAGIARSNIVHHSFRHWLVGHCGRRGFILKQDGKFRCFGTLNGKEHGILSSAWKRFRDHLSKARQECLKECQRRGAGHFELTDVSEATDGTHP